MYKLISDSSCDLDKGLAKKLNVDFIPFKITIDGKEYVDDDDIPLEEYLTEMERTPNPIKTACPSPFDYLQVIEKHLHEEIYIITISSKLSGSYNSAHIAVQQAKEAHPNLKISVIDSKSASAGQTKLVLDAIEVLERGLSFEESLSKIHELVENMYTFFVLDNMKNLIKNGRIKKTTGLIANVLNIRPIMQGVNGEIELFEMNRGTKKALNSLANAMGTLVNDFERRRVAITHVNAVERANEFAKKIEDLYHPKEIIITQANGLSSGYADIGGIVLAF